MSKGKFSIELSISIGNDDKRFYYVTIPLVQSITCFRSKRKSRRALILLVAKLSSFPVVDATERVRFERKHRGSTVVTLPLTLTSSSTPSSCFDLSGATFSSAAISSKINGNLVH